MNILKFLTEILHLFNGLNDKVCALFEKLELVTDQEERIKLLEDKVGLIGESLMAIKEQISELVIKIGDLQDALAVEVEELRAAFEDLKNRLIDIEGLDISPQLAAISDAIAGVSALSDLAVSPDTEAPGQPGPPSLSSAGPTSISISWSPAQDNVGVVRYDVIMSGQKVGESSVPSFTATGLAPENVYIIAVQAFDSAGNGSILSEGLEVMTTA